MTRNRIYDGTHAAPVDRTAGKVTGGGFQYQSVKKIDQKHWEIAPATIKVPSHIDTLVGQEFGRFKVIGLLTLEPAYKNRDSLWLVRCACSHFESRRSKSILNPKNNEDRCDNCRHIARLQRAQDFKSTRRSSD